MMLQEVHQRKNAKMVQFATQVMEIPLLEVLQYSKYTIQEGQDFLDTHISNISHSIYPAICKKDVEFIFTFKSKYIWKKISLFKLIIFHGLNFFLFKVEEIMTDQLKPIPGKNTDISTKKVFR